MLIVYRTDTGEVVDNSGTNSRWPEGPPDGRAFVNTDASGLDRTDLALLRLHDVDDADLVAQVLTHHVTVEDGEVVVGHPYPEPEPADPEPTDRDRIDALAELLNVDTSELDTRTRTRAETRERLTRR